MTARWAVFISGQGSNMSSVLDERLESGAVELVVSSSANCFGVKRARRLGVQILVVNKKIDWSQILMELNKRKITHIFLLGFMKVLPDEFLKQWNKPIFNVHPSLLPAYPGLKSIERAYNDNNDIGVTVHHVVTAVDAGTVMEQKKVISGSELKNHSLETIETLVHYQEYNLVRKSMRRAVC